MENPFTLTFGQKPTEFISRTNQIGKIIHTFDMENPSNKVYMVAGVRGSGKTVSLIPSNPTRFTSMDTYVNRRSTGKHLWEERSPTF